MTLHKMHSTAALKPDSSRHDNLRLVRVSRAVRRWIIMCHCAKHELITAEWGKTDKFNCESVLLNIFRVHLLLLMLNEMSLISFNKGKRTERRSAATVAFKNPN